MLIYQSGNLLEAKAEALVNCVNCVGIIGKEIALQFKVAFPDNFRAYKKECRYHRMKPGTVFAFRRKSAPEYIFNFATKGH